MVRRGLPPVLCGIATSRGARSEQDVDLLLPPLMEIRVAEGITFMAQLHSTREPNDASLDEYGPTSQD